MSKIDIKQASKFLSYILRHCPVAISLQLDSEGWAFIDEVIKKSKSEMLLTRDIIEEVVITSDKQRFKISADGLKIRANQGHSINIDLNLKPSVPPDTLYHGTASRFLDAILQDGLKSKSRRHVHLSSDIETAKMVGQRHGKPVILKINTKKMVDDGCAFLLSDNKVWLTDSVPHQYISVLANA